MGFKLIRANINNKKNYISFYNRAKNALDFKKIFLYIFEYSYIRKRNKLLSNQ